MTLVYIKVVSFRTRNIYNFDRFILTSHRRCGILIIGGDVVKVKKDVERKRMTLRIDKNIYKGIERESKKLGLPVNSYISMVLYKEINKGR